MYKRNLETSKRSSGNENAAEEIAALKGNKQFGPSATANKSLIRSNSKESSALKLKPHNQKSDQFSKHTNEKQKLHIFQDETTKPASTIPLKRNESAIGQVQHSQSKKQDIRVDRTLRHKEQEQEWAPQGLDLDFGAFDDTVQESTYQIKRQSLKNDHDVDVESFPVIERQFSAKATIQAKDKTEEAQEEETAQPDIEHDTSTVEYCPPKEKEIPYEPDQSCIIDTSRFTSHADLDAYEYIRLDKHHYEFILHQDPDALKHDMVQPINDDALEFDYDLESTDPDSELSDDLDFSNIPFSDHTFDVDHFIQSN
ncbi:hypothetical protein MBANPS3_002423 [Mucor bainieri]